MNNHEDKNRGTDLVVDENALNDLIWGLSGGKKTSTQDTKETILIVHNT